MPEGEPARHFDAAAASGGGRYRVRASFEPGSRRLLIVATTLRDVDDTLRRLLLSSCS